MLKRLIRLSRVWRVIDANKQGEVVAAYQSAFDGVGQDGVHHSLR
jgi:hypothetical protein